MKFLLISPKNRTVYNFRGDLLKTIREFGYEVVVTGPDQADVEKIEALGARFVEIPMNKTGTSVLGDIKYCRRLIRLMKAEKPDVTLGYTVKPVIYGAIAAKLSGVKNIVSMVTGAGYTFTAQSFKAKVLGFVVRMLYRIGFACADRVIFQNPDDRDEFTARGLLKAKKTAVVSGSGVNMDHFAPKPLPEKPVFFMLSRLLKSKGVREYLEAAEIVKKQYPEARFTLLGKYETAMQDAVPKEFVEPFIEKGIVERFEETSEVRPYYEQCGVYVLPSYREGTPRTVLEAMAMGRAILTTDTNGCRETVKDGVNGFLVPVGDAQKLAEKMTAFIEDPTLAARMGAESITYCREKFDILRVNDDMIHYLNLRKDGQNVTL